MGKYRLITKKSHGSLRYRVSCFIVIKAMGHGWHIVLSTYAPAVLIWLFVEWRSEPWRNFSRTYILFVLARKAPVKRSVKKAAPKSKGIKKSSKKSSASASPAKAAPKRAAKKGAKKAGKKTGGKKAGKKAPKRKSAGKKKWASHYMPFNLFP